MAITAAQVKELREKTGAGMMDCKKALTENNGDMEAAVKFLREKGLAAAAKKAGRVAAEGLVDTYVEGKVAAVVEVNCETDFVAKNDDFIKLVKDLAAVVGKGNPADGAALNDLDMDGKKVADVMTDKISTIGENMNIRRFQRMDDGDAYGVYQHMGGKIGVVVSLSVSDKADSETIKVLARDLAMHVASEAPLAIDRDGVDPAVIDNEKDIFIAQAKEQGKPDNIIEKMVTGKINKFLAESCLLDQAFVKDPDVKVKKLIEKTAKELGADISVKSFARFKVGEGIEKKDENFADEVAKMTGA
jgi:elongation factor Ts